MADKYVNATDLQEIADWGYDQFAQQADFDELSAVVQELVVEGGEPNVIEVVKVNNTPLTPDANKAVNVDLSAYALSEDVPTKTSDLTNDGDGTSNFATEDYVDENGGKIDSISIDGTAQTIDQNKNVALDLSDYAKADDVPEKVSDLTDDVGIQTASDVTTAINTALANGNDPYTTESDVDSKIATAVSSAYVYKGSVATVADLPSSGQTTGDVYDVRADGMNYAWNGTAWDSLGTFVDTSAFWTSTTGQANTLEAMTVAEVRAILYPSS